MKKIICFLVCTILLSIVFTAPAAKINEVKPTPDDIKYLDICVYKEENEELVPVHRAEVLVYIYPSKIPQTGMTYTDGYLLFQPTVRVGDDVKIVAYHEWFGGNTIMYSVQEDDPEIIHFDITLDPEKSIIKNRIVAVKIPLLLHKIENILHLIKNPRIF